MNYSNELKYLDKYIKENNLSDEYRNNCIKELEQGRPIQYIIGSVNFYGYEFKVNENVLIPRFETELLVEKTIKKIKSLYINKDIRILDLGTGSGCIAITLNKELGSYVEAVDVSNDALKVAKENNQLLNANVNFKLDDMTKYEGSNFDVIISNPPYIRYDEEIMDIVKNNEPNIALFADNDGLYFYEEIIKNIEKWTNDKYLVAFEIGYEQANRIVDIANNYLKDVNITVEKDYNNRDRFIFITKE